MRPVVDAWRPLVDEGVRIPILLFVSTAAAAVPS